MEDIQPRIGAHLSIGKGLKHTADEVYTKGLETLQVFLRNPRGRGARHFSSEEISYFNSQIKRHHIYPLVVHIPYICNPAAIKEDVYQYALETVQHDLARCDLIGADFLVLHPGSYTTSSLDSGIDKIAQLLNKVLDEYEGKTMVLLETMAGQGTEVGKNFTELNRIIQKIHHSDQVGVCFDTCHTYAAGYDSTTMEGLNQILLEADKTFGRQKIKVVHANDSLKELGSHRDRHAHIGEGFIGESGFKNYFSHQFWRQLPFILETPADKIDQDISKLKHIRDEINQGR